jgi:hypothetical protein
MFCGGAGVIREHAIPEWIGRQFKSYLEQIDVPLEMVALRGGRTRQAVFLDATVRVVCEQCNNGWLSDLETRVQPILAPMILGFEKRNPSGRTLLHHAELGRESQETLALWAVKTALVIDRAQVKRNLPDSLATDLFRHLWPSANSVVWLAAVGDPNTLYTTRYHRTTVALSGYLTPDGIRPPFPTELSGVLCSLRLNRALFQVLFLDPAELAGGSNLSGSLAGTEMVWPTRNGTVVWPPGGRLLEGDELAALSVRRVHLQGGVFAPRAPGR